MSGVEAVNVTQNQRDKLVEKYRRYAENVVLFLVHRLKLPAELHDELRAAAYLGLVEASSRYNPKKSKIFKAYAFLRIRGSVIDTIRNASEISAQAYQYSRALQAAQEIREYEIHDEPAPLSTDGEAVCRLARIFDYASKGALAFRLSYEDQEGDIAETCANTKNPEDDYSEQQSRELLREVIAGLPEKERQIIVDYYFADKSFVEIAHENIGVTKSWVSRLHARAIDRLQKRYLEALRKRG